MEKQFKPKPVNQQALLNSNLRSACVSMEAELAEKIPSDWFFNIFHISKSLAKGYPLARAYDKKVCNGLTLVVVQQADGLLTVFPAVCSVEDTFSRLDGRYTAINRAYNAFVTNSLSVESAFGKTTTVDQILYPGVEPTVKAINRAAINWYIKEFVNNKGSEKNPKISKTRAEVNEAEAALLATLKASTPSKIDWTLRYTHAKNGRTNTELRAIVANTAHNATLDLEYLKEVEAKTNATVTITRHPTDDENRLNARWFAVQKLSKKLSIDNAFVALSERVNKRIVG